MNKGDKTDMRALSLETLLCVEREGIKLNEAVNNALKKHHGLPKDKRAFFTRLTIGTMEQCILLDYILGFYSTVPVQKLKDAIRNILRLGLYQIRFMDSVPNAAAVNEAVSLAAKKGFASLKPFINSILRNTIRYPEKIVFPDKREPLKYISVRYSMPEFIVSQWLHSYGAKASEEICASFLGEKRTCVRIIGGKNAEKSCLTSLNNAGVKYEKAPYPENAYFICNFDTLSTLPPFKDGLITVQDISSMLAVEAAGIKAGDKILDVCAAPGGKSMLAAEKAGSSGLVIARDISKKKLEKTEENLRRCHIDNVQLRLWDALCFDESLKESMDVVLVDAPCSGYGVIGKKPDIKYNASPKKQSELAKIQRKILNTAAGYVKKGGRLIYSTCTLSEEENEQNVSAFLKSQPFAPYDLKAFLPANFSSDTAKDGFVSLLPGFRPCDGFFIAGFEKL